MTAVSLGIPPVRAATEPDPTRPDHPGLLDSYGRVATDLRVSLTDRCNLRCTYCMPPEGLDWLPAEQALSDDEVVRLIRIAVEHLGVRQVRFTGGEPLLRRGLEQIVTNVTSLRPRPRVSLTSNGIGLARRAAAIAEAGLDRVNISLDTLRPERFRDISRRNRLSDVLEGLRAAAATDLHPVKVNAVLLRDVNDDEAIPLLRYCLERGYQLRFIEQMPLDAQHGWDRSNMVTADEIMERLSAEFRLEPDTEERGSAPAERFLVDGGPGTVGIIGSVTRPFCGDCDRTRLTADGQVRACLFSNTETDLRGIMRDGGTEEEVANAWRKTMWGKLPGLAFDDETFVLPPRPMSAIGG
ncbi:MAG: GTP 3',8-cyclase MoaA [Pseudonocardiaceae bacterium]